MSENAVPIWGNELEYYINTGTAAEPKWVKITELLSWESSAEPKTYEACMARPQGVSHVRAGPHVFYHLDKGHGEGRRTGGMGHGAPQRNRCGL